MALMQYRGYIIQVKHYAAFRHRRREYPEVFDYIIFEGKEKICKGYSLSSAKEAIIEAKGWIDA